MKHPVDCVPCQLVQAGTIRFFFSNLWLECDSEETAVESMVVELMIIEIYSILSIGVSTVIRNSLHQTAAQCCSSSPTMWFGPVLCVCVCPCLCVCEASHVWVVDIHHWALNDSSSPPPCFTLLTLLTHQERNKHTHSAKVSRLTAVWRCWMIIAEQSS